MSMYVYVTFSVTCVCIYIHILHCGTLGLVRVEFYLYVSCVPHYVCATLVCDRCVSDSPFDISVSLSVCLSLPALVSNTTYT